MKALVDVDKECENCGRGLLDFARFYDAKTRYGPWAWLCAECFARLGCTLGTGHGQEYDSRTKEKIRG